MTRDKSSGRDVVHLSTVDWVGIAGITFAILVTITGAGIAIHSGLTEVLTRQEQLETRIQRLEAQIDRRD